MVGRTPPEGEGGEGEHTPAVSHRAGYTAAEGPKQDDWQQVATPHPADEEALELVTDYAKLGEHVTSVLEAAKTAAAKIRQDAREDAGRVAERTRKAAAKAVETARREAANASSEGEQLRAEAEKESRETRHRANAYLAEKRQEAEAEASGIVTRARREAINYTRTAEERRSALHKNVALTEERLRQLVGGLRDLAGRLEQLVEGQAAVTKLDATDAAPSGSLEASLRPSTAAQQSAKRLT